MNQLPAYELLQEIGRGEFARVFRAYDPGLGRNVAIKELHEEYRQHTEQMDQFWQEAQFLANQSHPHLVQVYALDRERGWIIMELMQGSLENPLARGALPPEQVRSVLQQALRGLDYLHHQNKLHVAIKPSNLLISDQGQLKLSDFAGTVVGGVVRQPRGSSKYLAPELVNPVFGPVGPGVDLYQLGFTALELLMGPRFESLFQGVGPHAIDPEMGWMRWHSATDETLPPVERLVPGIPRDLASVIDQLLVKFVGERYQQASEALRELARSPAPPIELFEGGFTAVTYEMLPEAEMGQFPPGTEQGQDHLPPPPQFESHGGAKPPLTPQVQSEPSQTNQGTRSQRSRSVSRTRGRKPAPRPWTPIWFLHQIKKPVVLYILLGLTVLSALAYALFSSSPPPKYVTIQIQSDPAGAQVFLDDRELDHTTNLMQEVLPGTYTLRLELEGYETFTREIQVSETQTDFTFPLSSLGTRARVRIVPWVEGAKLFVDKQRKTPSPDGILSISPGRHRFRLELPNESKHRERFEAVATDNGIQEIKLPPNDSIDPNAPILIKIISDPPGATVVLDGTPLDPVSDSKYRVKPGEHQLTLKFGKAEPIQTTITVKPNQTDQFFGPYTFNRQAIRGALLVGVQSYENELPHFRHAEADVTELGRTLKYAGYNNITVMTQTHGMLGIKGPGTFPLPDAEQIRKALKALVTNRQSNDHILLVLVGQAVRMNASGTIYYCPHGARLNDTKTLIPMKEIYSALATCRSRNKVVLLDVCRDPFNEDGSFPLEGAATFGQPEGGSQPDHVVILSSCSATEKGYVHATERHGLFGSMLIRGLRGEADTNKDNQISAVELHHFVKNQVSTYANKTYGTKGSQTPLLTGTTRPDLILSSPSRGVFDPYTQGLKALKNKDYQAAVAAFEMVVDKGGAQDYLEAYLQIGAARREQANYKEMLQAYERAIDISRANASAYDGLGDAFAFKEEWDKAIDAYTQAIRRDAYFAAFYNSRGLVHQQQSSTDNALADFTQAIKLSPLPSPLYLTNRAHLYLRLRKYPEAVSDYQEALAEQKKRGEPDAELFFWIGLANLRMKRFNVALAQFDEAIKRDRELGKAYRARAETCVNLESYDQAIKDATQALKLLKGKGGEYGTYSIRGTAHYYKGKYAEAIADFTAAINDRPPLSEKIRLLIWRKSSFLKFGDEEKAKQDQQLIDMLQKELKKPRSGI